MGSSGGGGGSSSGTQKTYIRYAGYVESHHETLLNNSESYGDDLRDASPYTAFVEVDFDDAIYGAGYAIGSFPSLYDMYGKFIGGLDIEALFEQVLSQVANTETVQSLSEAHRDLLDDDIEQKVLPRFRAGMRDINSVISSTFLMGEAVIEQGKVKALADYDAKMQYNLINVSIGVFSEHLKWNQSAVATYLDLIRYAFAIKIDENKLNFEILAKNILWPFTIMSHEASNLGTLQGARGQTTTSDTGVSATASIVGGALSGAAAGAMISGGNPYVAAAGAVVGGISGWLSR